MTQNGRILLALAGEPKTFESLKQQTGLNQEILEKGIEELVELDPPAVSYHDGKYKTQIPILTGSDFATLVPECDRIAGIIFSEIVKPHFVERKNRSKEMGYRWPLPADTYVRDKALQILVEKGLLSPIPNAPVDWNFGFWGWHGFLRIHDEIAEDVKPDPFLSTPISDDEGERIAEANSMKASCREYIRSGGKTQVAYF